MIDRLFICTTVLNIAKINPGLTILDFIVKVKQVTKSKADDCIRSVILTYLDCELIKLSEDLKIYDSSK